MLMPTDTFGASAGSSFVPITTRPSDTMRLLRPVVGESPFGFTESFAERPNALFALPGTKSPLPLNTRSPSPFFRSAPMPTLMPVSVRSWSIFRTELAFAPGLTSRPAIVSPEPVYQSVPRPSVSTSPNSSANARLPSFVVPLPTERTPS